jgi:hypothetical protein
MIPNTADGASPRVRDQPTKPEKLLPSSRPRQGRLYPEMWDLRLGCSSESSEATINTGEDGAFIAITDNT